MRPVKIHEAKTHFSRLIALVEQGHEVVVQRGDTPVAKLVPYDRPRPRVPGALRGQIVIGPDFDAIPEEFGEHLL